MKKDPRSAVQSENRRLAAIMFTDIVGFSRQMGADEARMLRLLEVHNQLVQGAVAEHHGMVVKTVGDAFLVDFPSVVNAVQCAQQIQAQLRTHNAEKEKAEQIHVRIGIHLGDIVQKDGDVFGDGVNIASRLQSMAEPDTICISQKVYEEVAKKLNLDTVVSLGKPKLKNIAERFAIYALLSAPLKGIRQTLGVQYLKLSRRVSTAHRVAAMAVLLALVSVGTTALRERYFSAPPGLPLPDKPSIVVLPFNNMSNDPSQDYFSDGITEDITTDLSQLASLFVIARNSAFTYKGKAVKVQDISRELGVRYVLEGSVRRSDNQVRITAQLIDAVHGQHLWSERYDRSLQDIFAVQDEIRQQIVFALKVKLTPEEQARFRHAPTNNLEAYNYYLRGKEYVGRVTKEANAQARQMFEKAIELDPQYAAAHALQSLTYVTDWNYQWSQDRQVIEQAFAGAQKAIILDDSLALAHSILGFLYHYKNQPDQAIAEGERAVVLDPNNPESYLWLAGILSLAGRAEEGIAMAKNAMRLNPHYPPAYLLALGRVYHQAWHNEEAIATLKKYSTLNPNAISAYTGLACSYSDLGRYEEARAAAAEVLRLSPNFTTEAWKQAQFIRDPAQLERHITNLRKAGLP
jgi:TolB-like protein/class 3 adenylate cyclase